MTTSNPAKSKEDFEEFLIDLDDISFYEKTLFRLKENLKKLDDSLSKTQNFCDKNCWQF